MTATIIGNINNPTLQDNLAKIAAEITIKRLHELKRPKKEVSNEN